eukprot:m51a1_g7749 hypothetical protein (969) ;mRNA; r:32070-35862
MRSPYLLVPLVVLALRASAYTPDRLSGHAALITGSNYLAAGPLPPLTAAVSVFWWHQLALPSTLRLGLCTSPARGVVPRFMMALAGGTVYVGSGTKTFFAPGVHNFTDGSWWSIGVAAVVGGNVTFYAGGARIASVAFPADIPANESLYLVIGSERWGRKLNGLVDDIAVYNVAVNDSVAAELGTSSGRRAAVGDGLVGLWDFDDPDDPLGVALRDSGIATSASMLRSTGWAGRTAVPTYRRAAPWRLSPIVPVVVKRGALVAVNLLPAWAQSSTVTLLDVPVNATLRARAGGPALGVGGVVLGTDGVAYGQASASFTVERIRASVDGRDFGSFVAKSTFGFYVVGMADITGVDASTYYYPDADGQRVQVYVTSMPRVGKLHQVAGPVEESGSVVAVLPAAPIDTPSRVTHPFHVVCYVPGEWQDVNETNFTYVVSDGIDNSSEYTVVMYITEPAEPNKKGLISQNVSTTEAAASLAISLQVDRGIANPRFVLTSLPSYGTLHQGTPDGPAVKMDKTFSFVRQWVSSVVNVSSFWYDASGSYSPLKLIGRPNCYPLAGDCDDAWSPASGNKDEWIRLRFEMPVYIVGVEVYETYYPGNTVRIQARGENGEWFPLWKGSPDKAVRAENKLRVFSPSLFLSSIPQLSSEIIVSTAAAGPDVFVEIDAVMLIGATTIDAAVVHGTELAYVPLPHVDGLLADPLRPFKDAFTFAVDDAEYYMRYRDLDISEAQVAINVAPANDAPFFLSMETVDVNSTGRTLIVVTAVDYDGPSPVSLTLVQEPARGVLTSIDGRVLTAGSKSSTVVFYTPRKCGQYSDGFTVVASDSVLASPEYTVSVSVLCSEESGLLTTVLVAVIVPVGAILAASVAAVVVVSAYMRRRVSVLEDEKEQLQDELSRFHKASDMINTPAEAAIMTLQDIKTRALHGGSFAPDDGERLEEVIVLIARNKLFQAGYGKKRGTRDPYELRRRD